MNVLERVKQVIAAKPDEGQIDKFLSDLRESLATSNKLFLGYSLLTFTLLTTYHLVVHAGATGVAFGSLQLKDASLFQRVFLVVPSFLLAAMACVGFLRRCQREVYDFLAISRCTALGSSGLHELRLPSDHILGLYMVNMEGGAIGKVLAPTLAFLSFSLAFVGPAVYVACNALANIQKFGVSDLLCTIASCGSTVLSVSSLLIIGLSGRIKAH